jgi:hypothetical protein
MHGSTCMDLFTDSSTTAAQDRSAGRSKRRAPALSASSSCRRHIDVSDLMLKHGSGKGRLRQAAYYSATSTPKLHCLGVATWIRHRDPSLAPSWARARPTQRQERPLRWPASSSVRVSTVNTPTQVPRWPRGATGPGLDRGLGRS